MGERARGRKEEGQTERIAVENSRQPVVRFEQLRVYQQGFVLAMKVFHLSKGWPREEQYSLTDQVRRSSRSICANIAEAWHKRRYAAHFISKLSDADTEVGETRNWLYFALECGYLAKQDFQQLTQEYDTISGGLVKMMVEPDKWCGPSSLVKEESMSYETE